MNLNDKLKELPYREAMKVIHWVKVHTPLFNVEWPEDDPSNLYYRDPEATERELRARWNWEGVKASYNYEGQVAEVRRAVGVSEDGIQLATHLRAREKEGGGQWVGHIEASRYEHPHEHIHETHFRTLEGEEIAILLSGGEVEIGDIGPAGE